MAEAVGLTAAIITVVETAYSSCRELYGAFDGVRDAPKHIATISNDLQDFYLVLGTIQTLLNDEEFSAGIVRQAQSANLCKVLEDCKLVFKDFNAIICEYQAHDKGSATGTWQRLKWIFKESEMKALQHHLVTCKITLNLAISMANYYNTRAMTTSTAPVEEMAAHMKELERLPEILQQLENTKTAQLSPAAPHGALDRAGVRIDYRFALRHYVDSAVSVCSGINTTSTPSFQVSALETSSSLLTSEYYTAPISQTSSDESRRPSRKCTQILVRNVGLYQTMAFQVAPEYTIETIKSLVRERVGLENAKFELLYSGSVLSSSDKSIDEYGISHDATLTCISFRPTDQPPAPCRESLDCVVIKTLTDTTFRLSVEPQSLVRYVKDMSADRLRFPRPEDIRLIHGGKQLADRLRFPRPVSFWQAPFGTPWVKRRRVYYGIHRVK